MTRGRPAPDEGARPGDPEASPCDRRRWIQDLPSGRPARLFQWVRRAVDALGWDLNGVEIDGRLFRCESVCLDHEQRLEMAFPTALGPVRLVTVARPARLHVDLSWPVALAERHPVLPGALGERVLTLFARVRQLAAAGDTPPREV